MTGRPLPFIVDSLLPTSSDSRKLLGPVSVAAVLAVSMIAPLSAAEVSTQSFLDDFDRFDLKRWYVSDGWANGDHQNCTWSKRQLSLADGKLTLSFEKRPTKDRAYVCAEVRTKSRYGYGVYEARLKTDAGSGLNAAFFTYVGPPEKVPHDEIDFEVLTQNTSKVDVNTYVGGKPQNGTSLNLKTQTDAGFNDYAFVWEKDRLRWYVNGELLHTATGDELSLPSHPQAIFFSFWGTEKLNEWMGPFTDPGRKLIFEVDRVAYTAPGQPCQFEGSVACGLK